MAVTVKKIVLWGKEVEKQARSSWLALFHRSPARVQTFKL
jgi:hypothetical protein